jgi:bla regulator protein blaR1
MIVAVALLGYATLLLTAGAAGLARARWADRAPRLAVAARLALTGMPTIAVLAAFPLVLLAGPAAAASGWNCCPHTVAAAHARPCPCPCGTACDC